MKKIIAVVMLVGLSGCGWSGRDSQMIGQVKKVMHNTPILCDDYMDAEISLGVMQNGTGSMSTEDKWVYVPNQDDYKLLQDADEKGSIVKVTYDTKRIRWCVEEEMVTKVELVK